MLKEMRFNVVRIAMILLTVIFASCEKKQTITKVELPIPEKIVTEFGYTLNDYEVIQDTIEEGDSFGWILDHNGVNRARVYEIASKVKDSFDVRRLKIGKKYTVLKCKDSSDQVDAFIYQPNKIDYNVVHINDEDSIYAEVKHKKVITKRKMLSGIIESSLSAAIEKENTSPYLTHLLSRIYQWSIDFFRIQKGDRFKVIYNERYLEDGTFVGIENVEASVFEHLNEPFYAFEHQIPEQKEDSYFDENGKSLQSFFLKAPLNFSRISSRYSGRRFHPVQKRWKSHKGTDYAAPTGTPIWSTANGTVIKAGYTRGNGKYVKIKHNSTYSTQYLHMSKILVRRGQQVKQGQVIGKVGSTGLATGPHVCYRFWHKGRQIDPYRHKMPHAKNIAEKYREAYLLDIKYTKEELDSIPFKSLKTNTLKNVDSLTIGKPNTNESLAEASRSL